MPLTREQFDGLRSKGLSIEQIVAFESGKTPTDLDLEEKKRNEGVGSKIFRAVTEPVVTLATRPFQLAKALSGQEGEDLDVTLPYYGKIKSPTSGKDVIRDIGRGFETVSLGIGGAGTVSAVKSGLSGLVKAGLREGAEVGLKTGALTGFGQGLEQATEEPPEKAFETIFSNTALGATTGLVGGTALGAVTPLATKAVGGVSKFANLSGLEEKLSNGYKKILNPTARQIKVDSRFGNDSFTFLSKEAPDLPLEVDSNGRLMANEAIDMLKQKYIAEATAYKPIIRNSGKYIDIDNIITKAKKDIAKELDGSDLSKAERQIEDEINSFLSNTPQDVNVLPNGKRFVTIARADDIKTYSWSRGKGWGTPEAEVWNDTNNIIGHTLKEAIEKELPSAPIKAMNNRLGQWKNAIDMVEKRNGQVSGSGGRLSKNIMRAVGTSIGSGIGGENGGLGGTIGGMTGGFMTANALAAVFANPNVRLAVVRQLIKNLKKAGKTDMIKEAQDILQEQSVKYLLPSAGKTSYIEKPIVLPQSVRETNLGLDEVRGMNQSQPKYLESAIPIETANTTEKIKDIISDKIPQSVNKAIPNKEGGFSKSGVIGTIAGGTALGTALSKTGSVVTYDAPEEIVTEEVNPSIISGIDISKYATDPNHEKNVSKIYNATSTLETVNDINTYIKQRAPKTPVTGEMILNASKKYDVDPALIIAIIQQDSLFGTKGLGAKTRNPGNVANTDDGKTFTYPTWQEGVNGVARFLAKHKIK